MNNTKFPIFKGLQKPLEFMGIRGRFIVIAAVTVGVSFLGFLATSSLLGQLVGFIFMIVSIATGLITIYIKQKSGLHNKKTHKGLFVYKSIYKR